MLFDRGSPDRAVFLRDYWQQRPLLLRQALPDFRDPLSPEELAGLACEEGSEARLVFEETGKWSMRPGPFAEADFTSLPDSGWTLLVQGADQWLADVKALLDLVGFLPRWRLDDVMISYAARNAGVGPHFDYYDVFIIQGEGSRLWKIGQHCDASTPLDTSSGLKILERFAKREEWLLERGDVLYIPPGVAHYGTAVEPGLSYSIGFRAPSLEEVLWGFTDELCQAMAPDQRYTDPRPLPAAGPGEIAPAVLERLAGMVREALEDRGALARWFGRHVSEQKQPDVLALPEQPLDAEKLAERLRGGLTLMKNPLSRYAWLDGGGEVLLFADGENFTLPGGDTGLKLARRLNEAGDEEILDLAPFLDNRICLASLAALYNQGSLIEAEESEP